MVKVPIWAILYYLRVADLMGTQVFLYKRHRQQNNEILIRHSPGIGECFLFSNIQLTKKIKKSPQGAVKMPLSFSFYVRVFLTGKNKNFHQEPVFMPFIF